MVDSGVYRTRPSEQGGSRVNELLPSGKPALATERGASSLRRLLYSPVALGLIDADQLLPGVDSPEERQRIASEASRQLRLPIARTVALLVVPGFVAAALYSSIGPIPWIPTGSTWVSAAGGAIVGMVTPSLLSIWTRRRIRPAILDVLRREGRCLGCGYLIPVRGTACPECGKSDD